MENIVSGPWWGQQQHPTRTNFENKPAIFYGSVYFGYTLCRTPVYALKPSEKGSKFSEWFQRFVETYKACQSA